MKISHNHAIAIFLSKDGGNRQESARVWGENIPYEFKAVSSHQECNAKNYFQTFPEKFTSINSTQIIGFSKFIKEKTDFSFWWNRDTLSSSKVNYKFRESLHLCV